MARACGTRTSARRLVVAAFATALLMAPGLVAPVAAAPAPGATSTNLIANGTFSEPVVCPKDMGKFVGGSTAITDWTVGEVSVNVVCHTYFQPETGDQSIDLSGTPGPGSLAQTVPTTSGNKYTLSWFMAGNPSCGQAVKTMDVDWNGTLVDAPTFDTTGHSVTSMGWQSEQITVSAVGATSTVLFADATPDMSLCGATLDNVSLVSATGGAGAKLTTKATGAETGHAITDTAVLSGTTAPAGGEASGTITFDAYGPTDPHCSAAPVFTEQFAVSGNGRYGPASFIPPVNIYAWSQQYRWVASYSGDPNNGPVTEKCGTASEISVLRKDPPPRADRRSSSTRPSRESLSAAPESQSHVLWPSNHSK